MKIISTKLELAYSPLSARDLAWAQKDEDIYKALDKAHLYMIAKKPQIYFSNLRVDGAYIKLDIENINGKNSISIPTRQAIFNIEEGKGLFVDVGVNKRIQLKDGVCEVAHGLKFYKVDDEIHSRCQGDALRPYMTPENFVLWLSPEKLLYHYKKRQLRIPNFDKSKKFFWDYKVLYIGKATEQGVLDRLEGHKKFLRILQSEMEEFEQIRDDVVVLFFKVSECDSGLLLERNTPTEDFVRAVEGSDIPSVQTLCLEAEKIFVNEFQPKHNEVLFKQYPKGEDGLHPYGYDIIGYTIEDEINLQFNNNETFVGGCGGNYLVYSKGNGLKVLNEEKYNLLMQKKIMAIIKSKTQNQDDPSS